MLTIYPFLVGLTLWTPRPSEASALVTRCRPDSAVSVNVLLDNSVTVRDSVLGVETQVSRGLATLAGLLRRGDIIRLYRLASEKGKGAPRLEVIEIDGTDPDSRARYEDAVREVVSRVYRSRQGSAQNTDLAESLRSVGQQVPNNTCTRIIILITDGALDPFITVPPDQAVRDVNAAVVSLRRQGFGLYALGLRANRTYAIDTQYRAKLASQDEPNPASHDGMRGDALLRQAFGEDAYYDFRDVAVFHSLFISGPRSVLRSHLRLRWETGLPVERLDRSKVTYLVYEASSDNASDEFFSCPAELPDSNRYSVLHVVTLQQDGRCFHYVQRPPTPPGSSAAPVSISADLLRRVVRRSKTIGWDAENRIHASAVPPVIRSADEILVSVDDSALAPQCAAKLWEALRSGSWPSRREMRDSIVVYFFPVGEGEALAENSAQDSLALFSLPNQPRCYAPAAPWDTRLSTLPLDSVWLDFRWMSGREEYDDVLVRRKLDFSPAEHGSPPSRIHAAVFMPFNTDVWYLSGALALPGEAQWGKLEVGPSSIFPLTSADNQCPTLRQTYRCWVYNGLYRGSIDPLAGRVVFGAGNSGTADARGCGPALQVPDGCRYVDLRGREWVPDNYGFLMRWWWGWFVLPTIAVFIHVRYWRQSVGWTLKAVSLWVFKTVWHIGFIFLNLVFLTEAVLWAIRVSNDPTLSIQFSTVASHLIGIFIAELGMALVFCYYRYIRQRFGLLRSSP